MQRQKEYRGRERQRAVFSEPIYAERVVKTLQYKRYAET
jgi:hypothetical protein